MTDLTNLCGYRIERELGRGASGIVFLGTKDERAFAIKLMKGDLSGGELLRFRREAAALGRANHPGLVQISEIGEFEGRPFIAMEFVDGEPLSRLLEDGPLAEAMVR